MLLQLQMFHILSLVITVICFILSLCLLPANVSAGALGPLPVNTSDVIQQWANTFDGIRAGAYRSVITDTAIDLNDGSVVTVGFATGSYIFHSNAGGQDAFAVKTSPTTGQIIWARWYATPQDDMATGVCIDAAGNVYVSGSTSGFLQGNYNSGNYDIFVVKLTADGDQSYLRLFGTGYSDLSAGCAVDVYGNVYVVGQSQGALYSTSSLFTSWSVFFARIVGSTGVIAWGKNLGSSSTNQYVLDANYLSTTGWVWQQIAGRGINIINPIANVTNNLTVIVSFGTDNTAYYNDFPTAAGGNQDAVMAAYTITAIGATKLWAQYYQTATNDIIQATAVDSAGSSYVTGYTSSNLDHGLYSGGGGDVFVSKVNLNGVKLWTRVYGTSDNDMGLSIDVDNSGGIYVGGAEALSGSPATAIDGLPNPYYSQFNPSYNGNYDIALGFISKFDTDGARLWTADFSAFMPSFENYYHPPSIFPTALSVDPISGNIYFGGKKMGVWSGDQWPVPSVTLTDTDLWTDFAFLAAASQTNTNCTLQQLDQLLAQIDQLIVSL